MNVEYCWDGIYCETTFHVTKLERKYKFEVETSCRHFCNEMKSPKLTHYFIQIYKHHKNVNWKH